MTHPEAQILIKMLAEAFHEHQMFPGVEAEEHPVAIRLLAVAAKAIRKFADGPSFESTNDGEKTVVRQGRAPTFDNRTFIIEHHEEDDLIHSYYYTLEELKALHENVTSLLDHVNASRV